MNPLGDFAKAVAVDHLAKLIAESKKGLYMKPEALKAAVAALPKERLGRLYDTYARETTKPPTKDRFIGWVISEQPEFFAAAWREFTEEDKTSSVATI